MLLVIVCRRCVSVMEKGSSPAAAAAALKSVRLPSNRRTLYRRSNTLSALPLDALQTASSPTGVERRRPLVPVADSPETGDELTAIDERTRRQTAVARHGRTASGDGARRVQFCRKTSCNDLLLSTSSGDVRPLYSASASSGLMSSSSSSSRLLSKVKERIRDTVLQTTSEWPAVVQERRQRAAIQFELRAARMLADEQQTTAKTTTTEDKGGSRKSPSGEIGDRKEAARAAFRRHRSVSCEDAVTTMLGTKLHPASAAATTTNIAGRTERRQSPTGSDVTGIVCSKKDLQAIMELSRQETVADDSPTAHVISASIDSAHSGGGAVENSPDAPSPGKSLRRTTDVLSVEVHAERSSGAGAASSSVDDAKPINSDRDLPTPPRAGGSDVVPVTSSDDRENATAREPTNKPPEVLYDDDGRTWDVYGAQLNPEVLGDAIERHLQHIMLSATSVLGMTSQVAALARSPAKHDEDDSCCSSAASATDKPKQSDDDCQTARRRRNVIQKYLPSLRKRPR